MKVTENRHYRALELPKVLELLAQHTSCEDARELALAVEPQTELAQARALINQTEAAFSLLARFGGPSFGALKNVNNALFRANAGGTLTMKELLDVSENLRVVRSVSEWRFRQPGADSCLDVYFSSLMPDKFLEDSINNAIMSEDEMSDRASPALADIRRKLRQQSQSIREKLDGMVHSSHYQKFLQDAIITQRNGRFVVPVKNEYRGEISGLVHDTSGSGATVFIEPMAVVEANNEIRVLKGKEREEIERILAELSAAAGMKSETIKQNYEALIELNVIFAKAQLAYSMKASVPELNDSGIILLNKARHPLIDKNKVVPTDISLGEKYDTLVITGPNTGGKTVSLKTIGLLTLMAECGLLLPAADGSKICVFGQIFADIGDEQSIEQSLSTFSSHMVNLIDIINKSGENSLVLIDELGAGTDPVEGAALAIAILERLHLNQAKAAATTHYAELKAYALETDRVENACCEFDVQTLKPTYRLLIGVPGRSNAFAITERLGMDEALVLRAKQFVSDESVRFENVVDSLEQSRLEMENERDKAAQLKAETEQTLALARNKLADVEDLRRKEFEKAQSEALRITENARREANSLLFEADRLRKEMKSTDNAAELASRAKAQMKKSLTALDHAINPVTTQLYTDDDYVLPRELRVGDTVLISDIGKQATVLSLPDKKDNVEVMAGTAKTRVKLERLRLIEKKADKKPERIVSTTSVTGESRMTAAAENRCDIRGMTVDEGIFVLEGFIDNMLMTGLNEFTIIHGKGTGALRAGVTQFLKGCRFVKGYRRGVYGEGEDGVTIVTLK